MILSTAAAYATKTKWSRYEKNALAILHKVDNLHFVAIVKYR